MIDFSREEWRVLDRWLAEHHPETLDDKTDPDDDELFGIFEAVEAFNKWAAKNSIEKYLDANQPGSALTSQGRGTT